MINVACAQHLSLEISVWIVLEHRGVLSCMKYLLYCNYLRITDQCGVCGGTGVACIDCSGKVNGTKKTDACGVCGGDNGTCYGCDNKPSGLNYDLCGVCNGTNKCTTPVDQIYQF